jgi:hypothetical protein
VEQFTGMIPLVAHDGQSRHQIAPAAQSGPGARCARRWRGRGRYVGRCGSP